MQGVDFEYGFFLNTFPNVWVERYRQMQYFDTDPIIATAATRREPFHWFDIERLVPLTDAQRAYIQDATAHGLVDGFAIPV